MVDSLNESYKNFCSKPKYLLCDFLGCGEPGYLSKNTFFN